MINTVFFSSLSAAGCRVSVTSKPETFMISDHPTSSSEIRANGFTTPSEDWFWVDTQNTQQQQTVRNE